jgi:hypothetical protein
MTVQIERQFAERERRRIDWQMVAIFGTSAVMAALMIVGAFDVAHVVVRALMP